MAFVYFERLSHGLKIISYYSFFILICSYLAYFLAKNGQNNLFITHLLALGEFIYLAFFYKFILIKNHFFQKRFKLFIGTIGGLIILNTLFIQDLLTFNSYGKSLFQVVILALGFFYFYEKTLKDYNLPHQKSINLINSAILLYYSGSFLIFLSFDFLINNLKLYSSNISITNGILYLLFTILLFIAYLMAIFGKQEQKELT